MDQYQSPHDDNDNEGNELEVMKVEAHVAEAPSAASDDVTSTNSAEEDPALMSVIEKRTWLAKFGESNREHFEKGKLKPKVPRPVVRKRINHIERLTSPARENNTGTSGSSDADNSRGSSGPTPDRRYASSTPSSPTTTKPRAVRRSESFPTKRDDSPENPPLVIRKSSHDFLVPQEHPSSASDPFFREFSNGKQDAGDNKQVTLTFSPVATTTTFATESHVVSPYQDRDLVATSSNEGESHFRIVHAQSSSLLVPPKPRRRHYRRSLPDHTSWEAGSEFSDPFLSSSATTNALSPGSTPLWHPAAPRHRRRHSTGDSFDDCWNVANSGSWSVDDGVVGLNDSMGDNDACLETSSTGTGNYTDPGARTSQHRRHKELSGGEEGGNKAHRSIRIRQKLPLLLCKSNKKGDERSNSTPPSTAAANDTEHLMPRLQRGHSSMTMTTASTKNTTESEDYTVLCTRRNTTEPHSQLHLPTTDGVCSCRLLESEEEDNINTHIHNDMSNVSPVVAMHNATILQDRMLTSNTLELLCGSGARVDPAKYYSGGGEEGTVSTWDDLSSGPPSIVPGAVASKLGDVFAEEAAAAAAAASTTSTHSATFGGQQMLSKDQQQEQERTYSMTESLLEKEGTALEMPPVPSRGNGGHEQEPPKDSNVAKARARITALQQPTARSEAPSTPAATARTATSSSDCSPTTRKFNDSVRKFGGPQATKSTVQLNKEKLQKKWAMDREPVVFKKTAWYVCKKTGTYRKKVALKFSKPEEF